MRNSDWNRDELILALDLYFKLEYGRMHGTNPEVIKLSNLLSKSNLYNENGRTTGSVSLKLANFKRFDSHFSGKGMKSGAESDTKIWTEFLEKRKKLEEEAQKIRLKILKNSLKLKKQIFSEWLAHTGKPDGSDYSSKTIKTYASQIESTIQKEWPLELSEDVSILNIDDYEVLKEIQTKLTEGRDSKYRKDLRSAFQSYLKYTQEVQLNDSSELPEESESKTEGGKKVYISKRAERDPGLRAKAIAFHKTICKVCEFDFGKTYGEWGEGFIEVHHLIPIGGKNSKERKTNPETDLTVVCANCHRMLHRRRDVTLTIEELRNKVNNPEIVL